MRNFLDAGQMKPVLTLLSERPQAFADVPVLTEVGIDFQPLMRFRGFWTHKDTPAERKAYLETACKMAFDSDSFQAFNEKKYMTVINSYRDTAGSVELIKQSIDTYKAVYKEIGLIQ